MRLTLLVKPGYFQSNVYFDGRRRITCSTAHFQSTGVFENCVNSTLCDLTKLLKSSEYLLTGRLRLALNVRVYARQTCLWERELNSRK